MRDDQKARLEKIEEDLLDALLDEADPSLWNGAGQSIADMDQETRGNRYWCKKNAQATLALTLNVNKLMANTKDALGRDPYKENDMDKQIAAAERAASELLDKVGVVVSGGRVKH